MFTAQASLLGPRGASVSRCLFDNGSTRSFITKDKARELGATVVDRETFSFGRFKEVKRKTSTHDIVEVGLQLVSGQKLTLRLRVVDLICTPIQLHPFDTSEPSFSGVELAEPPVDVPKLVTVDVLLGLDYYHALVGTEQRKSQRSGIVVLTRSSLGLVSRWNG